MYGLVTSAAVASGVVAHPTNSLPLGAVMFVGDIAFEWLPNVHPVTMLTVLYTVAYGKKGHYTYNQFLKDSYEANGQVFSIFDIQKEADEIELAKKKKRAEERAELAAKMKKIKEETGNLI